MKFTAIVAIIGMTSAVSLERDNGSDWGLAPTRKWIDGPGFPNDPNQRAAEASQNPRSNTEPPDPSSRPTHKRSEYDCRGL